MKYNAVFKFFASILCAAFLLTAAASGTAIGCMGALGLYSTDVQTLRAEEMALRAEGYAYNLAGIYGSRTWGSCPESLIQAYFGNYNALSALDENRLSYEILDENGTVLESGGSVDGMNYEILLDRLEYVSVVKQAAPEDPDAAADPLPEETQPEETAVGETLPEETVADETAPEETVTGEAAEEPAAESEADITTEPAATETEPAATETEPAATQEPVPAETEPAATEAQLAETEATFPPLEQEENTFLFGYYDPELGGHREVTLCYEKAPVVTVRLSILDEENAQLWALLEQLWNYRVELLALLGASVLLFVLLLVYLCCAAGHKPGRKELRAGGLNRIPLDLGIGLAAVAVTGLIVLGYEAGEYFARQNLLAAAAVVAAAGYCCALIVVCFVFGFAAQVKTPGGFWWRNSLCALGVRVALWLVNRAVMLLAWVMEILLFLLRRSWRLCRWKLYPLGLRAARALWKLCRFFWSRFVLLVKKLWVVVRRCGKWCWQKLVRFVALLPLTWQWLLAAFLMILLLAVTVNTYRSGLVLLGLVLTLAMVLYGASAFGTLLESARRMRKGDLDTKVDESFLIGSFREFAQELNGLADVAMVAAQKQLKSERMKTELITNVSHDIKTPLTSIINYVDLLSKPHTDEEQEQYLEVLSRQSQRLKKLVEDLMEMSKASSGNLAVEIGVVDAVETVNQALGEYADKLAQVPLYPVFRQPEEPVKILADGAMVWRVLSNILGNAVKYALPGTRLYVDILRTEGKVLISLKNISREELNMAADELMERFVRGDASRNTEGSGLGLNIASSLMQLQKGQLQLLVDGDLFKVTLIFPEAAEENCS